MCPLWLKLLTILCLNCAALSDLVSSAVQWKDFGGYVIIKCRPPEDNQMFLSLKKGLTEDDVVAIQNTSKISSIDKDFRDRLQINGTFPSMDILIKNLTSNDTGPFWCIYVSFDKTNNLLRQGKGKGSVLVVVKDKENHCDPEDDHKDLILISIVAIISVLLFIIMSFFLWIIKKRTSTSRTQLGHVNSNDVYEDMRGRHRA